MQQLTKAEEQIMQVLWQLGRGLVKDVIEQLPAPKPAYNTVSTIVRILEQKGFVGHKAYGKTHEYFPLVNKADYSNKFLQHFLGNYFGGSFQQMVSFFIKQNNVDLQEFEELLRLAGGTAPNLEADDQQPNPDQP
jgi:BlaI family transcriptional regulator, penicillinase repressor